MSDCYEKMSCLRDQLAATAYSAMASGAENVDTHEMGEVVDMIKDIAEYERNHYQACYYKSVVNAMKYNGNDRRGYMPVTNTDDDIWYNDRARDRYGVDWNDDYGRHYNQYKSAKRHYTETHDMMDKDQMTEHAKEHLNTMMDSVREMWRDADPELRQKIKDDMTRLTNELM